MSKYYSKFYSDMLRANFESRESEKDLSDALMTFIFARKNCLNRNCKFHGNCLLWERNLDQGKCIGVNNNYWPFMMIQQEKEKTMDHTFQIENFSGSFWPLSMSFESLWSDWKINSFYLIEYIPHAWKLSVAMLSLDLFFLYVPQW